MMDARKLRAELDLPATDAAERLSAIALGLASGEVGLATAGRSHLLRPGPDVRMELDASQGEHDGRLTIGLIWKSHLGYGLPEWLEQSSRGLAAEIQPEPYDTDGGDFLMPGNDQSFDFSTRSATRTRRPSTSNASPGYIRARTRETLLRRRVLSTWPLWATSSWR